MAVGAILYALSPIDIVPEVLGPIGLADDVAVLAFASAYIAVRSDRPEK